MIINNNNDNDNQQENTNIIVDRQTLHTQLDSETVCRIYEYFNMILFQDISTENHLKTEDRWI